MKAQFKDCTFVKGTPEECLEMLKALEKAGYDVEETKKIDGINHIWYGSVFNEWMPCVHLTYQCRHELTQEQLYEMIGVKKEVFDPSKPFEVSDDGIHWDREFDHYIGCDERHERTHFVSRQDTYGRFKLIRNIQPKKVKLSEIESITVNGEIITNFEIEP